MTAGLYVHVPFCARKCRYCDFYSLPQRENLIPAYIKAVTAEAHVHQGKHFQTLYVGGGTPSLLGPQNLSDLMGSLRGYFNLSSLGEATIEVNPESATKEFLDAAMSAGFNRVSVGVQSLSDTELESVGRIHDSQRAIKALNDIRTAGFTNVSADVIIGLPGQDWTSLKRTLDQLLSMRLEHISAYCLSIEEGTPLAVNPPANLPTDDRQAELFERTCAFLKKTGFVHYEISNFARPGFESRHNLNYWHGGEYLGLGPAAASHMNGRRFRNNSDLTAYIGNPSGQISDIEDLDPAAKAGEEAMLRLRLLEEGLDCAAMAERFSPENVIGLRQRLEKLVEEGLLEKTGTRYILPGKMVMTANQVLSRVVVTGGPTCC